MDIDVSTPALLFPAISLLLLAFTNRFLGISQLIRQLRKNLNEENYLQLNRQISNLKHRVNLIIWMQAVGVFSLILCTVSMISYLYDEAFIGYICFTVSLALMLLSLLFSLVEITISGNALSVELEGMKNSQ